MTFSQLLYLFFDISIILTIVQIICFLISIIYSRYIKKEYKFIIIIFFILNPFKTLRIFPNLFNFNNKDFKDLNIYFEILENMIFLNIFYILIILILLLYWNIEYYIHNYICRKRFKQIIRG